MLSISPLANGSVHGNIYYQQQFLLLPLLQLHLRVTNELNYMYVIKQILQSKLAQAIRFLTCIRDMPCSNLDHDSISRRFSCISSVPT